MRKSNLSIHSENILPIIKKWLYSDKDIFIRELVSNACDALTKVRTIQGDVGEFKISITIDKAAKTIAIADTGIGMTEEEVEKYIAQIAFSGAEEFVAKYQSSKEPIIGHFGLGFYSSYMVASLVEIDTLSYLENAKPVLWTCDGSSSYTIDTGKKEARGTLITLHLDENSLEYLEDKKLHELLERHCKFMPYPIDLNGNPLGNTEPLWKKNPADCTEEEYLQFYRKLFPSSFQDPIFWIHLNVDYPFHLQGILYFPKIHRRFDSNESTIQLYCNRVFVSDNCKDILPDYLMILKGAIDSPDIPLNVSRSYLQVDKNVKQLSSHISKKVSDKLNLLYKNEREKFLAAWPDIEMIMKLGILQDEKFYDRVKDILIWKNNKQEWAPITTEHKKVLYSTSEHSPLLKLYSQEILFATTPIDTAIIQFLETKLSIQFKRIDGALDDTLLNEKSETATDLLEKIKTALPDTEVETKNLNSNELPALVLFDENQRRLRDYMQLTQGTKAFPTKKTFVVNTNHKLIQSLSKLFITKPELASDLTKSLYDLTLLSQKETDPQDLESTIAKQTNLLEKMASLLV